LKLGVVDGGAFGLDEVRGAARIDPSQDHRIETTTPDNASVSRSAPTDSEIIAALRKLHERFESDFSGSIDGIDAWVRHNGADAPVIALLERDIEVAHRLAIPGHLVLMTAHGGVEYKLHDCVVGLLRQTRVGRLTFDAEAERFLQSLRVTGGVVAALIRIVVFGFSVSEPIDLPFGQLVPAMRRDIVLPKLQADPPDAVVLEAIRDVPAVIGDTNNHPWTDEDRVRNAAAEAEAINDPLDRLTVALAVSYANPIQEHLAYVGPLYAGGSLGRNPLPIGFALLNPPPHGYPKLDIERLKCNAEIVARVPDTKPIAVAARRYFMAISERARPADKLIDLVIAIEALTDESQLEPQRKRLVQLLTGGALSDQKIRDDFTLIKYARNDIVHKGKIAPNADSLAGIGRMYVDLAIQGRVREAIQAAPHSTALPSN
jgi:hypothetical protein